MIVLLSCSTSWSKSNTNIFSTGELTRIPEDSVLIDIETLKLANAKLIELKYEKEINDSLRSIIIKDDKLIEQYNNQINTLEKQITQIKKQLKISSWGGIGVTLLLVISLIVK